MKTKFYVITYKELPKDTISIKEDVGERGISYPSICPYTTLNGSFILGYAKGKKQIPKVIEAMKEVVMDAIKKAQEGYKKRELDAVKFFDKLNSEGVDEYI